MHKVTTVVVEEHNKENTFDNTFESITTGKINNATR